MRGRRKRNGRVLMYAPYYKASGFFGPADDASQIINYL